MDSWCNMSVAFNATANNTNIITVPYTGAATQVITLMCWFYTGSATPANYRDIVTVDPNIYMQLFSDGATIDFGTANHDHTGSVLATNTWYHLTQVVVPTSTTAREIYGYINGQLNVNVADADTSVTFTSICIGNSVFSAYAFPVNGSIKDVRIWTRQLSAVEINDEMSSSIPIHRPALYLWAPLDDNSHEDKSGNNNILTVGSAVTLAPGFIKTYPKKKAL